MTGRTYRYASAESLFPFGFGLSYMSYTRFNYSDLALDKSTFQAGESLSLHCTLTNSGSVDAEEVAQIYLSDLEASTVVPLHSLIGFRRVHLKPGEYTVITFTIMPEMMQMVNDTGDRVLEPGEFRVTVGGCSPSERGLQLGAPAPVSMNFTVTAKTKVSPCFFLFALRNGEKLSFQMELPYGYSTDKRQPDRYR